jgi:hypothetical protein
MEHFPPLLRVPSVGGFPLWPVRCMRMLGRMFLLMLHHVDELAQWIANVETAHAPRFALGTVFNWQACLSDFSESYLDVINLD